MLVWGQETYRKQIPFDKANVATFSSTVGCKQFRLFRACLDDHDRDQKESESFTTFDATLIVDDEEDGSEEHVSADVDEPIARMTPAALCSIDVDDDVGYAKTTGHHDTSYERYKNVATLEDVAEDEFNGQMKPTSEILLWQYRMWHISFFCLQTMARTVYCHDDSVTADCLSVHRACTEFDQTSEAHQE
jgi:hypothetical protein